MINATVVAITIIINMHINHGHQDTRETMFLCQRLSVALQKGNVIAFQSMSETNLYTAVVTVLLSLVSRPAALC